MRYAVLVRHGESHWNVERRIQGQGGTGLSERGHAQARHAASWLADAYGDAHLHTSDLQRCVETVAPLEALLGRSAVPSEALRERHFGAWQGRLVDEVADDPAEQDRFARWRDGADVVPEVGGESSEQLAARVAGHVRATVAALPAGGAAVFVTHGGSVWHGLTRLVGLANGTLGGVGNTSISELAFHDDRVSLVSWNMTAHLPADLRTWQRAKAEEADPKAPPAVGT